MKKEYYFITWLRVVATVSILLCHFVSQSKNIYINMTGQFFNIGVYLFLIISGFLFGVKNEKIDFSWCKRRFKRIYIPYGLFLCVLFAIFLIIGCKINWNDWIFLALGIQGTVVGVLGAEHTWFISEILICYLLTPIIDKMAEFTTKKDSCLYTVVLATLCASLIVTTIPIEWIRTLGIPVIWYALAYLLGKHFGKVRFTKSKAIYVVLLICLAFMLRIVIKTMADETFLYNELAVPYTQGVAAFSIMYLFENKKTNRVIQIISNISFEIYLYHYMFCVGPLKVFENDAPWIFNCFLALTVTSIVAFGTNRIVKRIM